MDERNNTLNDHVLKSRKLVFEVKVVYHATPASKLITTDLPGVCFTATEGLLTPVTGIEAISGMTNYTAPSDANGIMDVMLKGSQLGTIKKVQSIKVAEKVAAGLTSPTVQVLGDANGLTAGGNIAFEIDTATNLATTTATFVCEVDYLLSE